MDERAWTKETLLPVLRRMGFVRVQYEHGPQEAGRDVVFAEVDKFGLLRYFAAQVKIGAVRAQSETQEVRTIVAQAQTAHETPFRDSATGNEHKISAVYLIVKGPVTAAARNILHAKTGQWFYVVDGDQLSVAARLAGALPFQERALRAAILAAELESYITDMRGFRKELACAQPPTKGDVNQRRRLRTRSVERVLDFAPLYLDEDDVAWFFSLIWAMDGLNTITARLPVGMVITQEAEYIIGTLPGLVDEFLGRAEKVHTLTEAILAELGKDVSD